MRAKKFPPPERGTLAEAQAQVADVASWARNMGYTDAVEPRLKWASDVIRLYIDRKVAEATLEQQ